ncbi:MAG: GMP synthase [glutamine-hydrolyzing] [Chitinophagales bacterium]|nr:MAG: GMP synthase [glutamine-hydrolyzing] [Chitinophagales bacterium]
MHEKILIIDFGSQYTQLIARRVRELHVYSEIVPYNRIPQLDESVRGIILSGSPFSVRDREAPDVNLQQLTQNRPLLAVCYGAQLLAAKYGGEIQASQKREYGRANLDKIYKKEGVFHNVSDHSQVWMSHGDTIIKLPETFELLASTGNVEVAAFQSKNGTFRHPVIGLQFHPEVYHTTEGTLILKNFVFGICGCKGTWTPASFIEEAIYQIRNTVRDENVVMGLSGGVDSTVAAELLHRAIGENLYCLFVNNGLLRKNEFESVLHSYKDMGLNIKGIDASRKFLDALAGVVDPEQKRKIIGRVFVEVFQEEASRLPDIRWLGQGTIYPDVIESVSVHGPSATIKSHHNVGGLPEKLHLKVIEPLRFLFKDEVREVGKALNIPAEILNRHPFPGPGLAIRIIGAVNENDIRILQDADEIFIGNLKKRHLYDAVWQAATILLPVQSVGVMGDERTYERVIALRAVTSTDGMTADWAKLPYEFLAETSSEIINKVQGVNRVVYDISSKPPSTIEWE